MHSNILIQLAAMYCGVTALEFRGQRSKPREASGDPYLMKPYAFWIILSRDKFQIWGDVGELGRA